jgi:hypothetical protein
VAPIGLGRGGLSFLDKEVPGERHDPAQLCRTDIAPVGSGQLQRRPSNLK